MRNASGKLLIFGPFVFLSGLFLFSQYYLNNDISFPIDDAWIHLEFAKNLSTGNGFSFNPNHPIAASTAPLFTCILAFLFLFSPFWKINVLVFLLGISLACLWLMYKLTYEISNKHWISIISAVLLGIHPWFIWSAVSGMEISFAIFLLLLGLYFEKKSSQKFAKYIPIVSFSLLTQVRPEMYVWLALYLFYKIFTCLNLLYQKKATIREVTQTIGIFIATIMVIITPYAVFAYKTTGNIVTNTYYAKVGSHNIISFLQNNPSVIQLINQVRFFITQYFHSLTANISSLIPGGIAVLIVGMILFFYWAINKRNRLSLLIISLVSTYLLSIAIFVTANRITWPWTRHLLPLLPLFLISFLVSISLAPSTLIKKHFNHIFPRVTALITGIGLLFYIAFLAPVFLSVWNDVLAITRLATHERLEMTTWINENIPPEKRIAASDIGIVGFYTNHFIIDTEGLINPDIKNFTYQDSSEKDLKLLQYLESEQADYLLIYDSYTGIFDGPEYPLLKEFARWELRQVP